GADYQPRVRRRVRPVSRPARGARGGRIHLAPLTAVEAGQGLEGITTRSAVGQEASLGIHLEACPADDPAGRCAARSRSTQADYRAARLRGPAHVFDGLSTLALRRD